MIDCKAFLLKKDLRDLLSGTAELVNMSAHVIASSAVCHCREQKSQADLAAILNEARVAKIKRSKRKQSAKKAFHSLSTIKLTESFRKSRKKKLLFFLCEAAAENNFNKLLLLNPFLVRCFKPKTAENFYKLAFCGS